VKLKSGRTVVAERIGDQHYLIWSAGKALTEVRCVPSGADRWYSRGSQLNWARSRAEAIQNGIFRAVKGVRINGKALEAWSAEAVAAMTPNVEFSGTPAALSPEAPLERRVGGAVPPAPTFEEKK